MAGARIRGATLTVGAAVAGVGNLEWNDGDEYDRSPADDALFGPAVRMKRQGSGSITLLEGTIATGAATGNMVASVKEVSVANGVESVATKTHTFHDVTFNGGASIPAGARGERRINFEYSYRDEA